MPSISTRQTKDLLIHHSSMQWRFDINEIPHWNASIFHPDLEYLLCPEKTYRCIQFPYLKLFCVPVVFAKQPSSYGAKNKLSWFRREHFKIVVRVWESDRKSQTVQTNFSKRIQTRCQISERLHVLKVFLWYLHYCFRSAKHFKLGTTNNFWKRLHIWQIEKGFCQSALWDLYEKICFSFCVSLFFSPF